MSPFIVVAAFAILAYTVYRLMQIGKRPPGMPPGPPTIPVLGNNHQVRLCI
jgi:hypothetical protein